MSQIFAFGDSITWGAWDEEGGWADRLKKEIVEYVDRRPGQEIVFYNLGIPSNRIDQLLERFQTEVDARFDEDNQEKYFIFAFGANDAAYKIRERKFRVDPEDFSKNIEETISAARKYSSNLVFLTITPVDETKTDGVLNPEKSRKNEYVDKYNEIIKEICIREKIEIIDVNAAFNQDKSLLYDDGLHPNSRGHGLILKLVRDYLISMKQLD